MTYAIEKVKLNKQKVVIIISGTTARIGPWPPLTGFRDCEVYTM
jgi:hypothetical protein